VNHRTSPAKRRIGALLIVVLTAGILTTPETSSAAPAFQPRAIQKEPSVPVTPVRPDAASHISQTDQAARTPAVVAWPATGDGAVTADRADTTMADPAVARRAGINGLLFSVRPRITGAKLQPAGGKVHVVYGSFRNAYGGDWASRLQLVSLPACALTTPDVPSCRTTTSLATQNDVVGGTLSADAGSATVAAAALAGPAGSAGTSPPRTLLRPAGGRSAATRARSVTPTRSRFRGRRAVSLRRSAWATLRHRWTGVRHRRTTRHEAAENE
jgi:hypothetical protein